jgi:hypothetical protein
MGNFEFQGPNLVAVDIPMPYVQDVRMHRYDGIIQNSGTNKRKDMIA